MVEAEMNTYRISGEPDGVRDGRRLRLIALVIQRGASCGVDNAPEPNSWRYEVAMESRVSQDRLNAARTLRP